MAKRIEVVLSRPLNLRGTLYQRGVVVGKLTLADGWSFADACKALKFQRLSLEEAGRPRTAGAEPKVVPPEPPEEPKPAPAASKSAKSSKAGGDAKQVADAPGQTSLTELAGGSGKREQRSPSGAGKK